jgi:hypothetical protein
MSIGLLIKDAGGGTVLGPDSYTVRLRTTVTIPAGTWYSAVAFPAPGATEGMFAAYGHFYQSPTSVPFVMSDSRRVPSTEERVTVYPEPNVGVNTIRNSIPVIPVVTVGADVVVLSPALGGGYFTGNCIIYVFVTI